MLKAAFFSRPLGQASLSRVQYLAFQVPPERRNFSNISCKNFSKPKNLSTFLKPIAASPVTFRPISSEAEVSLTSVCDASATIAAEPTFHSLGLAHYYPSGLLQAIMEQIHLQLDMPWWATIVASKCFFLKYFSSN